MNEGEGLLVGRQNNGRMVLLMNKIITISRQYASGGREIGRLLGEHYNIPVYDHDLISLAAKESGFTENFFEKAEDKASNSLIYSIAMGLNVFGNQGYNKEIISIDDKVFIAQSEIIRKVANEGPCVIIGRCADYVLRDEVETVNIFLWGQIEARIKRAIEVYGMSHSKAEENVLKVDKKRANYYNYHSDRKWGRSDNYDISLQTDRIGIENSAKLLIGYIDNLQ